MLISSVLNVANIPFLLTAKKLIKFYSSGKDFVALVEIVIKL